MFSLFAVSNSSDADIMANSAEANCSCHRARKREEREEANLQHVASSN